jgi:hypothetical protein
VVAALRGLPEGVAILVASDRAHLWTRVGALLPGRVVRGLALVGSDPRRRLERGLGAARRLGFLRLALLGYGAAQAAPLGRLLAALADDAGTGPTSAATSAGGIALLAGAVEAVAAALAAAPREELAALLDPLGGLGSPRGPRRALARLARRGLARLAAVLLALSLARAVAGFPAPRRRVRAPHRPALRSRGPPA